MSIKMTVYTSDQATFDSYYYGYGQVIASEIIQANMDLGLRHPVIRTIVDYGSDRYRAQYQADRFRSGNYYADVVEE